MPKAKASNASPRAKEAEQLYLAGRASDGTSSGSDGFQDVPRKTSRVVRNGRPTTDLVLSASLDTNDAVFRQILELYVKPGSTIADVTYGRGVFWRSVPPHLYRLRASDIQDGVDCRDLPYRTAQSTALSWTRLICTHPAGQPTRAHTQLSRSITGIMGAGIRRPANTMKQFWIFIATRDTRRVGS